MHDPADDPLDRLPDALREAVFTALTRGSTADTSAHDLLAGLRAAHPEHADLIDEVARRWDAGGVPQPEVPAPLEPLDEDLPQIPGLRILRTIGAGGHGRVYLAERSEPEFRVAVKVIRRERLRDAPLDALRRFHQECEALARVKHSHIAQVHEAGQTAGGDPFLVMEFVEGLPLTDYCDQHRLSIRDRLALLAQVCLGVQHAHSKGVVHRDLKPSNVLVSVEDGRPVPKIIDFGFARLTDRERGDDDSLQTLVLGTVAYMSPEQAGGSADQADARADIYSLGVIAYELLAGLVPFTPQELQRIGFRAALRTIRETSPPLPSQRATGSDSDASEIASRRGLPPGRLPHALRGELDWIVMRSLEKAPERRYATADAFAADLQRYLRHEPVEAHPPSRWYRLLKFQRRNRVAVWVGAAVTLGALALGSVIVGQWLHARERQQVIAALVEVVRAPEARATALQLGPPWPEADQAREEWLRTAGTPIAAGQQRVRAWVASALADAPRADPAAAAALQAVQAMLTRAADADDHAEVTERVVADLAWSRDVVAPTLRDAAWRDAAQRIAADPRFAGFAGLTPQAGLVPLGPAPASGLEEFYHLRSAVRADHRPSRDPATGAWRVDDATGIVFALVPGGRITTGAQATDPAAPFYDPAADAAREAMLHEVRLAPFLLGLHEVTQAQWIRLGGVNESYGLPGRVTAFGAGTLAHPLEQVTWRAATDLLERHGLVLPTRVQWQHAYRAGTDTPWPFGSSAESLIGYANLAGPECADARFTEQTSLATDDAVGALPVDALRPNAWGFHGMAGNVWEWGRDQLFNADIVPRDGDGLRFDAAAEEQQRDRQRVRLGGSFYNGPDRCRATAFTGAHPETSAEFHCGLRAARALR